MRTRVLKFLSLIFCGLLLLSGSGLDAKEIPPYITYQAVLRDVNGTILANRENVDIRVSVRLGSDAGTIVYQEEHKNLSTNAYGLIHLKIGAGTRLQGAENLGGVPWGEGALYAQVEVQTDGTGYTNMGSSELLTVPYAFMAGGAEVSNLYEGLQDGVLPKYSTQYDRLVNSGVRQKNSGLLEITTDTIRMSAIGGGKTYYFPLEGGSAGQALVLRNNLGLMGWANVAGGGGGGGAAKLRYDETETGKLLYWNYGNDSVTPLPLVYTPSTNTAVADTLNFHGILYSDSLRTTLPKGYIWVGDTLNRNAAREVKGHILMDSAGNTSLNLAYRGVALLRAAGNGQDTLYVSGDSLWLQNETDRNLLYAYNQGNSQDLKVGIGLSEPEARLHVAGGSVRFTDTLKGAKDTLSEFYWDSKNGSLRMVETVSDGTTYTYGKFSVSLGFGADAKADNSYAIGVNATVLGRNSLAIGKEAVVGSTSGTQPHDALALGSGSKTEGDYGLAVGYQSEAKAENAIAVGQNANVSSNAIAIGTATVSGSDAIVIGRQSEDVDKADVILVGNGNKADASSLVLGKNNDVGKNCIAIGNSAVKDNSTNGDNSIVIGYSNSSSISSDGAYSGSLVIGDLTTNEPGAISIGTGNENLPPIKTEGTSGAILLGRSLKNYSEYATLIGNYLENGDEVNGGGEKITMIGNDFTLNDWQTSGFYNSSETPYFLFGEKRKIFLSMVEDETSSPTTACTYINTNLKVDGDADVGGTFSSSDIRLKTDIKPLSYPLYLLDSLQPVSFRFKKDVAQRTRFGFIAQEIQRNFPALVKADKKGMLSVDYIGLIPLLWDFNLQLRNRNDELEKQLEEQRLRIERLEAEMEAVREKLGL